MKLVTTMSEEITVSKIETFAKIAYVHNTRVFGYCSGTILQALPADESYYGVFPCDSALQLNEDGTRSPVVYPIDIKGSFNGDLTHDTHMLMELAKTLSFKSERKWLCLIDPEEGLQVRVGFVRSGDDYVPVAIKAA